MFLFCVHTVSKPYQNALQFNWIEQWCTHRRLAIYCNQVYYVSIEGALFLFQMIYIEIESRGKKKLVDVIYLSLSELNNVEETKKQKKICCQEVPMRIESEQAVIKRK